MPKHERRDVSDPLAQAARVAYRGRSAVKSVARALDVPFHTARNWLNDISWVSPHLRAALGAIIEAEILRQNDEERAAAVAQCRLEIAGGNEHELAECARQARRQVDDRHQEMDRAARHGRGTDRRSDGDFA